MQPIGEEHCWKDLNFYENDFTDELGSLLTDSKNVDVDANYSKFSPASSLNGEMKKKWVIENGIRYLMKVNANDYGQQSINEVIASKLHEKLGWDNYVQYRVDTAIVDGEKVPSSLCQLFTSNELELVSAYQLIKDIKIPNDSSEFEEIIRQAVNYGMEEAVVRQQLEYTILTDFILSNTDRHYNNFGFLLSSDTFWSPQTTHYNLQLFQEKSTIASQRHDHASFPAFYQLNAWLLIAANITSASIAFLSI